MNILMPAVTDRLQDLTGGGQLPQAVTEPDNLSHTPVVGGHYDDQYRHWYDARPQVAVLR